MSAGEAIGAVETVRRDAVGGTQQHTRSTMRRLAAWALILAWGLTLPARADGGLVRATNLQADAREAARRQVPILIMYSSAVCHFCERVKREYLIPMHKDRAYRKRVIIREVDMGSTRPLTGFDGKPTTEGAFAAAARVVMVPTIKVYDTRGRETGEPLVGLLTPDYYFGYLEAVIDEGLGKVRAR